MQAGKLRLDDQLCFALYAATNAVTRAYRPRLEPIGLTYPQYLVMLVLWQDGERPTARIAERLGLPANAITPLLDRLEASGLVRRRRCGSDRRIVHVGLTSKGLELEFAASAVQQSVACQTRLEPDALAELREALRALVREMEPGRSHAGREGPGHPLEDAPTTESSRADPVCRMQGRLT